GGALPSAPPKLSTCLGILYHRTLHPHNSQSVMGQLWREWRVSHNLGSVLMTGSSLSAE
ncbi:unnamed protein product, partial [Lampetra fluviatilis]